MTFEQFKENINNKSMKAGIDDSASLRLIDYLPRMYRAAHYFWSWIWILSIPVFIYVAIFYKWWVGILLLIFITPMISSATKKSASQFVLEYAQINQQFYEMLIKNNLLVFKATDEANNSDFNKKTPEQTINRLERLQLTDEEFRQIHHFENETVKSHTKYLAGISQYQSMESNNYIVALRLDYLESLAEFHNRKTAISSCVAKYKFNEKT